MIDPQGLEIGEKLVLIRKKPVTPPNKPGPKILMKNMENVHNAYTTLS